MSRLTAVAVMAICIAVVVSPLSTADPGPPGQIGIETVGICGTPTPDSAACLAEAVKPLAHTAGPKGLTPRKVKRAYRFPTSTRAGRGETIAIVVAYHAPDAEAHLRAFSRKFDLPLCTTANGCFRRVDQNGGTAYPPTTDEVWALEADIDLQWAHAIAPGAKLVLVEAEDNLFANLIVAVDTAAQLGEYVSMSWVISEIAAEHLFEHHFQVPGVSFFAGTGDLPQSYYPAMSAHVIGVGGTELHFDDGEFVRETAWEQAGGGCSPFLAAPAAQASFAEYAQAGCNGQRANPDLSLLGDPASGASVYTTFSGHTGWMILGGTSLSTPIAAAAAAVTRQVVDHAFVYSNRLKYRDIRVGSNAGPCLVGYDLCSGRGSPLGGD